jgi:lysophospholipase L1-like esterase
MSKHIHSYLALGDSYTIGEGVPLYESFPYQAVQMLRQNGHAFHAPEIVAKTGWTTFELAEHLIHTQLNPSYDFVTLLIGVNNQYRGLSQEEYAADFEFLLKKAIHFAGEKHERVIVISIPDWGATPFAAGKDAYKITTEIDAFNNINKNITQQYKCPYINITPGSREAQSKSELLAADKLHPSGVEYKRWAEQLLIAIEPSI